MLGSHKTVIKIMGVGGAGNNTLTRLMEVGVKDVDTIAANTDAQDLLYTTANKKLLLGRDITNGLGAGSNPQIGEDAAKENEHELKEMLEGSDMVFVTCGLGGGTGTGAAPVVAEIARDTGALTISIVTLPFTEEGVMRWDNARSGLEKLRQNSDTVIIIQNDKLLEIAPDLPLDAAFKVADEILVNAVKGITELVTEKGLVNLDFADVKAIMRNGGTAMIGIGESETENRAEEAVEEAIKNPLLDVDITGAKSALLHISGGRNMSLKDAKIVMKTVSEKLDASARVIWGARMDDAMNETLRVMLIVTGLRSSEQFDHLTSNSNSALSTEKNKSTTSAAAPQLMKEHKTDDRMPPRQPEKFRSISDQTLASKKNNENSVVKLDDQPTRQRSNTQPQVEKSTRSINDVTGKTEDATEPDLESVAEDSIQDSKYFDIKEIETVDTIPTEAAYAPKADRKGKRVFTEIFEEEAKGDLNILVDAIGLLGNGETDRKVLKDIKNACNSLKNTAQLFAFEQIEAFADRISAFMDFLALQKVIPIQSLQKALEDVPDTINDLMFEDQEALLRVDEVQSKFNEIQKALEQRISHSPEIQHPEKKK
ncbi:cell division protein FtsZ [candidate division KSB1 bacterium]|nr:cell division protein FtsZ [candidate division KSB1 bacterium]